MHKQIKLIDKMFIPSNLKESTLVTQYMYIERMYTNNKKYILLNNINVFGPYPEPEIPWDISTVQKIAIYNKEIQNVITWINENIVIHLSSVNYKTLDVLIRIATGMLNKTNVSKDVLIMFHDNMVRNLRTEFENIILSELPF